MMETCSNPFLTPQLIAQLGGAAFFAILFLQSGFDKLYDWNGNLAWIKSYFQKSPLNKLSFLLLAVLTCLEFSSGLFSIAAVFSLFLCEFSYFPLFALMLSGLSLVSLFLGMRMAKDYSSAASLAGYFAVWIGWGIVQSL